MLTRLRIHLSFLVRAGPVSWARKPHRDLIVRLLLWPRRYTVLTYADVTGELIRKNIVDGQAGVPLYLDVQMIDTNTCEPVSDIYLDFWHCNSTV